MAYDQSKAREAVISALLSHKPTIEQAERTLEDVKRTLRDARLQDEDQKITASL